MVLLVGKFLKDKLPKWDLLLLKFKSAFDQVKSVILLAVWRELDAYSSFSLRT